MARLLDMVWFVYFATHIPITLLFDSQVLFPAKYYPSAVVEVKTWYTREFKDCMMAGPPAWYLSFVLCEMFLQLPYILIATYAFFKGARECPWIRIPNLVYSAHVMTTLIAIISHVVLEDYSGSKLPCPRTQQEKLAIIGIYCPYFIFPFLMFLDGVFSSAYAPHEEKQDRGGGKKRR